MTNPFMKVFLLAGTVDAYDKTTKDLLVSSNIAPSTVEKMA